MLTSDAAQIAEQLVGFLDAWRATPLAGLDEQYRQVLLARGNTSRYVRATVSRIRRVISMVQVISNEASAAARTVGDLTAPRVQVSIASFIGPSPEWSLETANRAVGDMRSYFEWLVTDGKAPRNTMKQLVRYKAQTDPRHARRPFNESELQRLITAAVVGPMFMGLCGMDRAWFYRLAAHTGLRASEIAALRGSNFDFSRSPAMVGLRAAAIKARREALIPLRPDVAEHLQAWLSPRDLRARLFRMCRGFPYHLMIQFDCAAAGIAYKDAEGRFADVHALRHTFGTALGRVANIKTVQKLMRHSDVRMTARYMHTSIDEEMTALAALPALMN